jgi:hypothetical protein
MPTKGDQIAARLEAEIGKAAPKGRQASTQ